MAGQTTVTTVFLDRDGVINRRLPDDYVKQWAEFEFLPGAVEALVLLRRAGLRTVVVSNQRGIARGIMTANDVDRVHDRMQAELREVGAEVDAIYYCPHLGGPMRKPEPGMLLKAGADHPGIDVARSVMVGDSATDLIAGAAAGTRCVLLAEGEDRRSKLASLREAGVRVDGCAASLLEAVRTLPLFGANSEAPGTKGGRP